MAHAAWDATNERFRGTQTVGASNDFVVLNNTKSTLDVNLSHSSSAVADVDLVLEGGEVFAYRPGTAGTVTFTGTPSHTAVNVTNVVEWVDEAGDRFNDASASLVYTPF